MIVEFLEDDVKPVESETDYQIASNFIPYNGLNIGDVGDEFERYEIIERYLIDNQGTVSVENAMNILEEVKSSEKTQWSLIYNMETKQFNICLLKSMKIIMSMDLNTIRVTKT